MAQFRYRAYSSGGDLAVGDVEAGSLAEAEANLMSRGLTPFETRRQEAGDSQPWWRRELFQAAALRLEDLSAFTREFATLETAEVPLDDALRMLAQQSASSKIRSLANRLLAAVLDGATLSDAMGRFPQIFQQEYLAVVRAGEAGATLGRVLAELADMLERRVELRAKIRTALTYPALLVVMALASTSIVVGFLVPSIAPIFADSQKPMPAGLRLVVAIEENWMLVAAILAGVIGTMLVVARMLLADPAMRRRADRLKLRLPLAGPLTAQTQMAKFARTLGTLLRAGVPLLQGLTAGCAVVTNASFAADLDGTVEAVRNGESLARALSGVAGIPPVLVQMVRVGEESRKVDHMLLRVAVMFETQSQRRIDQIMGLLTPALTVAIAAVVGGLILTVMQAILGINELASQ